MRTLHIVAIAALGLAACHHATPAPTPASKPVSTPASTGALTEEQFKALHQLRGDHSPAPTGTVIDLGGNRAYLSLPPGKTGPMPGIVVIHEWWGLNEHIEHWADRLAGLGYAALAVDLYGGKVATDPDQAMALMKGVDDKTARGILDRAVAFLSSDPRIQATRRAVIGWCFGGGWSLQTALDHPDLDAVVMYYGMPETDPAVLGKIHGKLLGMFANKDTFITPAIVDTFEAALKTAGVRATILRYDADHAFANPSGAHYDEPAAADAWSHVVDFLHDTLDVAPSASVSPSSSASPARGNEPMSMPDEPARHAPSCHGAAGATVTR